ncbi:multidrug resistance protein MdtN [Serratia marcescens]|uniref:Multidrug resistance protein MdtN n=1 Tax=Serratia marcescens TaxID=615 RepID=A0A379Y6I9_SERMA|nr:multidrug resistance protein MdtN [Serratia marcescens]
MANKKVAVAVLAVAVITLGLIMNKFFIKETQQNTNDAYIRADISRISPQIAGEIAQVLVRDNQWVKQGELLAVIDPREFNVALAQATAQEQSARARQDDARANLTRQSALIAARAGGATGGAGGAGVCAPGAEPLPENGQQRRGVAAGGAAGDNAGAHAFRQ